MEQTTYTMPQIREAFLTMFDDIQTNPMDPDQGYDLSTNQVWHLFQNKLQSISTK